jgi:allantoinase
MGREPSFSPGFAMTLYDLLIRNGTLVTETAVMRADLAIADEHIVMIAPEIADASRAEIDASGLHIFPGLIDAHVHFNEPGRTDWEGFVSGSRALAAGGITSYCEMPLNAHPPTVDGSSFDLKCAAAEGASLVDFALWGGLVPGNVEQMDELAARGVIGFKAFMSNSGINDFASVDDLTLFEGMQRAEQLDRLVAVHAENDHITGLLARRAIAAGQTGIRDYLNSRPVIAELEAIARAILLAEETGCALHIVHVSTGRGVSMVAAARERGVDVSCETCPHYLVLTEDDMEQLGAIAKCAPPLRARDEQAALWQQLRTGTLPMVASDHSPAPADMKTDQNFFKVWGGISGCQSTLPLLLTEGYASRDVPLTTIAAITSGYIARRFRLPGKGRIEVGAEADLTMVDLQHEWVLQSADLLYRHQHSPYIGKPMRGRIERTLVRGTTVMHNGAVVSKPIARLLRPQH